MNKKVKNTAVSQIWVSEIWILEIETLPKSPLFLPLNPKPEARTNEKMGEIVLRLTTGYEDKERKREKGPIKKGKETQEKYELQNSKCRQNREKRERQRDKERDMLPRS